MVEALETCVVVVGNCNNIYSLEQKNKKRSLEVVIQSLLKLSY